MNKISDQRKLEIAKQVREACITAAREQFQEALMSGLCNEGAIEAAVGAIQSLDLKKVINEKED